MGNLSKLQKIMELMMNCKMDVAPHYQIFFMMERWTLLMEIGEDITVLMSKTTINS